MNRGLPMAHNIGMKGLGFRVWGNNFHGILRILQVDPSVCKLPRSPRHKEVILYSPLFGAHRVKTFLPCPAEGCSRGCSQMLPCLFNGRCDSDDSMLRFIWAPVYGNLDMTPSYQRYCLQLYCSCQKAPGIPKP